MEVAKHTLRFYKQAGKILRAFKEFNVSVKSQVYACKNFSKKALYAIVIESYKHEAVIDNLLKACPIEFEQVKKKYLKKKNEYLLRVLLTELLWGRKVSLPESKLVSIIMLNHEKLLNELSKDENQKLLNGLVEVKVFRPRYVRINTLAWTIEEAIEYFKYNNCYKLPKEENYDSFLNTLKCFSDNSYIQDLHMEDLFVFPPRTEFYKDEKYLNGSLILQDKSSCLAGHLLNPEPGSTVLDMCAAPGMKTTHLAAIMQNSGKIYAVDRDEKRFETLNELVDKYGATCVETIKSDVLKISADDCPNVQYILCDPSCSGGGMAERSKYGPYDRKSIDKTRLTKLSNFQAQILTHALTNFPTAEKVLYSTCSTNLEENEQVVSEVLNKVSDFKLEDLSSKLKGWKNFGSSKFGKFGKKCLYCRSDIDLCNGFFVALFKRRFNHPPVTDSSFIDDDDMEQQKINKKKNKKKKDKLKVESFVEEESKFVEEIEFKKSMKKKKKNESKE